MSFEQDKEKQLSRKDISNVGEWDSKIESLCNKLNKSKEYYTTSSCAGRVILLKNLIDKKPGLFIFRSHDKITFQQLKKELGKSVKNKEKEVSFKQEPCILHVACKSLESAQTIVDKAKFCGWKRSGIMATRKRFVCELMSTEHTEMPIISKGKILADDNFLKILVKEANIKLERTWRKIKKLEEMV